MNSTLSLYSGSPHHKTDTRWGPVSLTKEGLWLETSWRTQILLSFFLSMFDIFDIFLSCFADNFPPLLETEQYLILLLLWYLIEQHPYKLRTFDILNNFSLFISFQLQFGVYIYRKHWRNLPELSERQIPQE